MDIQDSHQEQIQPTVLARLAECAQRSGKSMNELLAEMLDERDITKQQPGKDISFPITPEE